MMKTILFLMTIPLCIVSFNTYAQTVVIDRPVNEDMYVLSTKGTDGSIFVSADSFEITEEVAIGEFDVPGGLTTNIGYLGNLEVGFNIYIYEDDNGVPAGDPTQPGTGILELSDISPIYYTKYENGLAHYNRTDFNRIQVTDANGGEQVVLQPGTYWVCFFLTVEGEATGIGSWGWKGSWNPYPMPPIEPVIIDPYDHYELGYTSWTNLSGILGGSYPSGAWTMRSEEKLGTKENALSKVGVYPNPSTGIVNVSIPSDIKVHKSGLFDMTGKKIENIKLINNSINISSLSQGVYLLRVETSKGVLVRKIIRK